MTDNKQRGRAGLLVFDVVLVVIFCVLMGLIIANKSPVKHEYLAMGGIVIMIALLVSMYMPVKKLQKDLDSTQSQLVVTTITDELTQVFNRKHFDILLKTELSRARRHERDLGCMMLDIDGMATINKKFGYAFGDEVLRDVAELVKENLRVSDIMARYEGNRFICLLPESNNNAVLILAKRLRGMVEGMTYDEKGEPVHVTVSIGLTSFKPAPDDKTDIRNIITLAEMALKKAKEEGGNRIETLV